MSSQREPSEYALAMIAKSLDHLRTRPRPTDYALATIAVFLDHPVLLNEVEKTLNEEGS
jgi:hypothetical protein